MANTTEKGLRMEAYPFLVGVHNSELLYHIYMAGKEQNPGIDFEKVVEVGKVAGEALMPLSLKVVRGEIPGYKASIEVDGVTIQIEEGNNG